MNSLIIEDTGSTPGIEFQEDGAFVMKGRCIPEDSHKFYNPIFEWISNFKGNTVNFDIRLYYLNTSSSKQLLNLIMLLKENSNIQNLTINWHFEEGDEDHKELGLHLEMISKIPFKFFEYSETE